jgi:hypothetical protein
MPVMSFAGVAANIDYVALRWLCSSCSSGFRRSYVEDRVRRAVYRDAIQRWDTRGAWTTSNFARRHRDRIRARPRGTGHAADPIVRGPPGLARMFGWETRERRRCAREIQSYGPIPRSRGTAPAASCGVSVLLLDARHRGTCPSRRDRRTSACTDSMRSSQHRGVPGGQGAERMVRPLDAHACRSEAARPAWIILHGAEPGRTAHQDRGRWTRDRAERESGGRGRHPARCRRPKMDQRFAGAQGEVRAWPVDARHPNPG